MPTLFAEESCRALHARIDALTPDRRPAWGKFSAPQMVAHLICALRAGLGEIPLGPPAGPLAKFPMNLLIIHVLPWPKGKAESPPEFLGTDAGAWKESVATLHTLVDRSAAKGATGTWPASPVFGHISAGSWGVLTYKHLDHHLRQFGA